MFVLWLAASCGAPDVEGDEAYCRVVNAVNNYYLRCPDPDCAGCDDSGCASCQTQLRCDEDHQSGCNPALADAAVEAMEELPCSSVSLIWVEVPEMERFKASCDFPPAPETAATSQ